MADKIVYLVVTNPGGIDGMDSSDKGGVIRFASYDKVLATKKVDGWSKVDARVIDVEEARKHALAKLDKLDLLVLGIKG